MGDWSGFWPGRVSCGNRERRRSAGGGKIAPDRRIVFLTWFRKTQQHEEKQIARAVLARKQCEAEHGPADADFHRSASNGGMP
jgi:hypothetical protein